MSVEELVLKNRSYRGYDRSYRFTRDHLAKYVDIARLCPSSVNKQPFKYYLAWDEEKVTLIQRNTKWARALPELTLPHKGKEPTAFIVICQDKQIDKDLNRYQRDLGIVAQSMLLKAAEEDLGGCMIGNFNAEGIKEALSLPENISPLLIVAFGKPDEKIVLTSVKDSVNYYRDENDVHYVPKRSLESELLD